MTDQQCVTGLKILWQERSPCTRDLKSSQLGAAEERLMSQRAHRKHSWEGLLSVLEIMRQRF